MKNPHNNQGGFWLSYIHNGRVQFARPIEGKTYSQPRVENTRAGAIIEFEHIPRNAKDPVLSQRISLWSRDRPVLLARYACTNLTQSEIEDLRVYGLMDFDLGGPHSYKDDSGSFDEKTGIANLHDDTPLWVTLASRPRPDRWDITAPTRLRLSRNRRDLQQNSACGPQDVAAGLQWNIGTLLPGESRSIDLVISAGESEDCARAEAARAWEMFAEKIR